jgi:hypothetical protein
VRHGVAIEIEHGAVLPAIAEHDARALLAQRIAHLAGIRGLMEQRDTRLAPQALAEEQRRIGRRREHGRADELRPVVGVREVRGIDLQMHLEARVAPLEQHRLRRRDQLVCSLDVDAEVSAATLQKRVVERLVTRPGRHVRGDEICRADGRQNSGQDDPAEQAVCSAVHTRQVLHQRVLELRETILTQHHRIEIQLQIKLRQLCRVVLVVQSFEQREREHGRMCGIVDRAQLLLDADATHAALEQALVQHPLESLQVVEQAFREGVALARIRAENLVELLMTAPQRQVIPAETCTSDPRCPSPR